MCILVFVTDALTDFGRIYKGGKDEQGSSGTDLFRVMWDTAGALPGLSPSTSTHCTLFLSQLPEVPNPGLNTFALTLDPVEFSDSHMHRKKERKEKRCEGRMGELERGTHSCRDWSESSAFAVPRSES